MLSIGLRTKIGILHELGLSQISYLTYEDSYIPISYNSNPEQRQTLNKEWAIDIPYNIHLPIYTTKSQRFHTYAGLGMRPRFERYNNLFLDDQTLAYRVSYLRIRWTLSARLRYDLPKGFFIDFNPHYQIYHKDWIFDYDSFSNKNRQSSEQGGFYNVWEFRFGLGYHF